MRPTGRRTSKNGRSAARATATAALGHNSTRRPMRPFGLLALVLALATTGCVTAQPTGSASMDMETDDVMRATPYRIYTAGGDAVSLDVFAGAGHERVALLLGAEGDGLSPRAVAEADTVVTIPMAGGVDSLNVAAAGAVAAWALRRPGPSAG